MNAVPTPRFDVGENTFAAQLLQNANAPQSTRQHALSTPTPTRNPEQNTHMTSGNKL